MVYPLLHDRARVVTGVAGTVADRDHGNHVPHQGRGSEHDFIANDHHLHPFGQHIGVRFQIDREPFRHILVPQPLAFANRRLREDPCANAFSATVGGAVARGHHRIGRIKTRDAVPIRRFGTRDHLPNNDPMRFLSGGGVRRDTNLLHPKRLAANIPHGLLLPSDVAHALVPRATIRIPEFVPEGNAVRLRPETGLPRHARHFLLLILVLQRHLLSLGLATILWVLRDGRDREPRLLIHHDLEPLVQRLVNHVVDHAGGITRTSRFAPRA